MSYLLLDGKKVQREIADDLRLIIKKTVEKGFVKPCLSIIQIGDNQASASYIRSKKMFGESIGANVLHIHLPENVTEIEVIDQIKSLNHNDSVHGIILQLPIPKHLNKELIIENIDHTKDVDGLTSKNVKGLWVGSNKAIVPATSRGIVTLLNKYNITARGKKVVVIGRSTLVGKPTAMLFLSEGATVSICHSETVNLENFTLEADIIISAVGRRDLVTRYHVRPGQVIVDVGINVGDINKKCSGDVDFDEVSKIVKAISPVPGGVGPMTVLSLFQNLIDCYIKKII